MHVERNMFVITFKNTMSWFMLFRELFPLPLFLYIFNLYIKYIMSLDFPFST